MLRTVICTVLILAIGSASGYITTKPDFLTPCPIMSVPEEEFTKCSTEDIQKLFENLYTGIEGLEDVVVDPLKINRIKVLQGAGPVSLNASLSKVTVTGFRYTNVTESKVSPKDFSWETTFFLPKVRIEGIYSMQGRILIIPLNGRGKCWLEPENMTIRMHTKTRLIEKDGFVFYNVTGTKVDYDISGLRLRFDNLFDGVKALEESTNAYLNENWRPVNEGLKPVIAKTVEDILLRIMRKIFDNIPANFFVSDIPKPSELYSRKN
ncbi:protein takeout-like [Phlebotomus argentipes]|uniref:protein takeout-like n=1 Tax=Phlebotomus argentipes TaxID=94469 RepID=UPI002893646C|nr:protein takeout-like [Phlebotomus argentipes]